MKNKLLISVVITLFLASIVLTAANQNVIKSTTFENSSLINVSNFEDTLKEEKIDVIVNFKEEINENILEENNVEIKEHLESIDVSTVKATTEAIKEIQKDPAVESVELDIDLELFGEGNDIDLEDQIIPWGIERVNAPNMWEKVTGKNIKIAVIDSGIDKYHLDLENNVAGGISFVDNANYWEDDLGHGTSVAGVISALNNERGVVGVAPESELYSIKVIGSSGGKLSSFIQGIQWAIDNDMDIIIMSLGIPVDSPSLRKIVDKAYLEGIILVAASGKDNQIYYPARYSSVIAVGSIDESNKLTTENGEGNELEFVAPGQNIISTNINGYGSFDGTSMAAPHVAGALALLKEDNPLLNPNELRAKLQRSVIDLGEEGKDDYFGYGLVYVNLEEENLDATIQIVFPEEIDEVKKEEYEINPLKIEIIKIEGDKEIIVQTLFYDGNEGAQSLSVEAGEYKVNQYFDNESYSKEYVVNEGDMIVVVLYKNKWNDPQFLVDLPSELEPFEDLPLLLLIKDANQDDACVDYITIDLNEGEHIYVIDIASTVNLYNGIIELDEKIDTDYWYTLYFIPSSDIHDKNNISVEFERVGSYNPLNSCFGEGLNPSIQKYSFKRRSNPLQKFNNWYCGDTHYHSWYTDTAFEFGAPLDATFKTAEALGMDWVTITDHSNSFSAHEGTLQSWENFSEDCRTNHERCLVGTEINCDYNSIGYGNHLLSYDYNDFIDDNFNGGELGGEMVPGFDNPSCGEMITNVQGQGGFTYVAHPESQMDILNILGVVTVGRVTSTWHNYSLSFTGLEVWNGDINDEKDIEWDGLDTTVGEVRTQNLEDGLEKWKNLTLSGRKVFISAGSDAHGDFNDAFGKEYTCVYAPSNIGDPNYKQDIFNGLENGTSYIGNNGALKFEVLTDGTTAILGETIFGVIGNSVDFNVEYDLENSCRLKLYEGIIGNSEETVIRNWGMVSGKSSKVYTALWEPGNSYYRVDCIEDTNRLYTNPIWVNLIECSLDADCEDFDDYTKDLCINPGTEESQCSYVEIICLSNNDCDDDDQETIDICHNPGMIESYCENQEIEPDPELIVNSPIDRKIYSDRRILLDIETTEKVDEIVYTYFDSRGRERERRLCRNCDDYNRQKSFREGFHRLIFRAYVDEEVIDEENTSFFIDYKDPRISRTEPRRGFSDGNFYVEFREDNPENLTLYYGNSIRAHELDIENDCDENRGKYKCSVWVNLSDFDNKEIKYWFELWDIAGNFDDSRKRDVDVDMADPVLNNPDSFWERGTGRYSKYIYFDISITELNFDEVVLSYEYRGRDKEKRLCSRLRYGKCEKRFTMRDSYTNLKLVIRDDAGNEIEEDVLV